MNEFYFCNLIAVSYFIVMCLIKDLAPKLIFGIIGLMWIFDAFVHQIKSIT